MNQIPVAIIVFMLGQTVAAFWTLIKMYFTIESLKKKMIEIESENKELKHQLRDLSDTLIAVKNNTDLLLLGRIKTTHRP